MPSPGLAVQTEQHPPPALVSVSGRNYPLRSVQIRARAEGGLASTTLLQAFANPYDEPLEVLYTMPLPADGAVLGYVIRMGERVIRGEIERREKAAAAYREALYQGRTAGLLEETRADTFQQRLGNLPPHTDVEVEIEILQPLPYLVGTGETGPVWEYRFPTVVSARYQGAPGRVSDAEALDIDRDGDGGIPSRAALELTVADDLAIAGEILSPSHPIVCTSSGTGTMVRLAGNARLDRDVVVRWAAARGEVGVRVVEGRGIGTDTGRYGLITVTPPRVAAVAYHRDLTVLIDASGSMQGTPLAVAKGVVTALLRSLESGDRFEVLAFANEPRRLTWGLRRATPGAVERCLRAVDELQAGGGTEMAKAIDEALRPLRADAQRQVVLLSDGYIGFEAEILARLGRNLPSGVRVHAVGIGSAPNRALTSAVARGGRGIELLVNGEGSVAETARRLSAATVRPVLTELNLGGSALKAAAPAHPRDVLAGQPLVIAAELNPEGGTLTLSGQLAGSREPWAWQVEVSAGGEPTTTLPIGALHGREAIADLEMDRAGSSAESAELDRRIEALGMRHRITSRRTSLVAIADESSVDPRAARRRERLPVELPAGVSAEGAGVVRSLREFHTLSMEPRGLSLSQSIVLGAEPVMGRSPTRRMAAKATVPVVRLAASVIGVDGPELVLELEAPDAGFQRPSGAVQVRVRGRTLTAQVLEDKSTPAGPHAAGVLVRLALRLEGGGSWPRGSVFLLWADEKGLQPGLVVRLDIPEDAGRAP